MRIFTKSLLTTVFVLCLGSALLGQNLKNYETYRIKVKFDVAQNQAINKVVAATNHIENKAIVQTGIPAFDRLNQQFRAIKLRRIFPDAGKFEARHRKYGLHLWYEIEFESDNTDIPRVLKAYQDSYEISIAEPYYLKSRVGEPEFDKGKTFIPNDPRFQEQWHYLNTAQNGGTAGADIKLDKAWDITTGDPSVIVAVIDGGIDINHSDLFGNMWVNEAELNGTPGVDDDNNG